MLLYTAIYIYSEINMTEIQKDIWAKEKSNRTERV